MTKATNQTQATNEATTSAVPNKAALAREIFAECMKQDPKMARKDIITRFVNEAGCTEKGAATYWYNCRKAAGMVTPRK